MSLTSEDKKDIAMIFTEMNQRSPTYNPLKKIDGNITEWLFSGLLALLLYVGNNIRVEQETQGPALQEMKINIFKITSDKQYYTKDLEDFRAALSNPQFTRKDYNEAIKPILTLLEQNGKELQSRSTFMADHEKRVTHLEYLVEEISKK